MAVTPKNIILSNEAVRKYLRFSWLCSIVLCQQHLSSSVFKNFHIHGVNILCKFVKLYSREETSMPRLAFQHTLPITSIKLNWSFPNSVKLWLH